jgi:hypothetical protein
MPNSSFIWAPDYNEVIILPIFEKIKRIRDRMYQKKMMMKMK